MQIRCCMGTTCWQSGFFFCFGIWLDWQIELTTPLNQWHRRKWIDSWNVSMSASSVLGLRICYVSIHRVSMVQKTDGLLLIISFSNELLCGLNHTYQARRKHFWSAVATQKNFSLAPVMHYVQYVRYWWWQQYCKCKHLNLTNLNKKFTLHIQLGGESD